MPGFDGTGPMGHGPAGTGSSGFQSDMTDKKTVSRRTIF